MKKLIMIITVLFYKYYDKGSTKIIAYESALIAVSALIFMNLLALLMFFKIDISFVSTIEQKIGGISKLILGLLLILPQFLILRFSINKEYLVKIRIEQTQIRIWNILLILYIVFSIVVLIISIKLR